MHQSHVSAVDTNYFYDTFLISLKDMHAFMSPTSTHWYELEKEEIQKRSLINEFDINCHLRILKVPTEDLPSVCSTRRLRLTKKIKLEGGLPLLKIYVTKEKIRDLMAVINTLTPPPPPPAIEDESEVGSPLPVAENLLPDGVASEISLTRTLKKIVLLSTEFTVRECSIIVRNTPTDSDQELSLLRTRFLGLFAHFEMSNNDMTVNMELSRY